MEHHLADGHLYWIFILFFCLLLVFDFSEHKSLWCTACFALIHHSSILDWVKLKIHNKFAEFWNISSKNFLAIVVLIISP